ncbi:MAG: alkaline phosphatase [Solirubrobacteraceae bacterium]|nr:alkaline phosphatase [Solirubrobacteraceae bacterium]
MRLKTGTTAALAIAGLAVLPAGAGAKGFKYGVTASEVTASKALIWTRADKSGKLTLELSSDSKFGNKDDKRRSANARKSNDNTVSLTVGGLKAGHKYSYRFRQGKNKSAVGRFTTAPAAGQNKVIRFAFSGDADAQRAKGTTNPFYNNFQVYSRMAKEGNLFNVNFGDTIYSDTEVGSTVAGGQFTPAAPTALTVAAKRAKYKQNLAMKNLQGVRAATGMYNHWDDHEFVNDFSKDEKGETIYKAGVKAFRNYMPVTYSDSRGIYRSFRWGKNAEVFFLDERSFRDAKASKGTVCNNPDTNAPDLAPTAPQRLRDRFALLTPSFSKPVAPACLAEIRDPDRTFLGSAQYTRFTNAVKKSTAKFKIIMNETPIQMFYALPYDRWEGYEAERKKLLTFLKDNVKNVVFLTTDTHANFYNDARLATFAEEGGTINSGINVMVSGPVATMTFEKEINGATGNDNGGAAVQAVFFKPPPPDGVGMACAAIDVYS